MRIERPAETDKPILELLKKRWSPRAFAEEPVKREDLVAMLEAARWAASCNNGQPWRWILATREDGEEYERLLGCLTERNQRWARQAPVLMIVCAYKLLPNGNPNPHNWYDCGAAMAQFTMQAESMGMRVHQMAGIQRDKVRETYGVPEDYDVCTGVACGWHGDPATLPEELPGRETEPRVRKPLDEVVFTGAFGTPSQHVG